jgi:hypothetical protein
MRLFLAICRRVQQRHAHFQAVDLERLEFAEDGEIRLPPGEDGSIRGDLQELGALLEAAGGPRNVAARAQAGDFLSADALAAAVERTLDRGLVRRLAIAGGMLFLLGAAGAAAVYSAQQARSANRRYEEIRALARGMVSGVNLDLGNTPASLRAREGMARAADRYLERLAQQGESDPALEKDLAGAYQRIGELELAGAGGQLREAADRFERANAIYGRIEPRDPSVAASREELHLSMAELYRAHLEPPRAVDHMKLAIRALETAIRAASEEQRPKMLERLDRHRALLAFDERRFADAARSYAKYVDERADYSPFQARVQLMTAAALAESGQTAEAEQRLAQADAMVQAVRKQRRAVPAYQMDRLRLHQAWIELYAATGRPWPVLERVTAMQKDLRAVPAANRAAEWYWLQCRMKLAETRAQLETKPWVAQPTAERARGLAAELFSKDPDSPLYRWFNTAAAMMAAVSRAERLKWEDVEEEADAALAAMSELAKSQEGNPFFRRALARVWKDQARWLLLAKRKDESEAAFAESEALAQ